MKQMFQVIQLSKDQASIPVKCNCLFHMVQLNPMGYSQSYAMALPLHPLHSCGGCTNAAAQCNNSTEGISAIQPHFQEVINIF